MWRLRSLIAMGHDSTRIARALSAPPALVRRVVRRQAPTAPPRSRAAATAPGPTAGRSPPPAAGSAQTAAATATPDSTPGAKPASSRKPQGPGAMTDRPPAHQPPDRQAAGTDSVTVRADLPADLTSARHA